MSVDAFTVDGVVNLNTEPFDSAIGRLVSKLEELQSGLSQLGIHTQSFTNEIGVADKQFDDLKGTVSASKTEIDSMTASIGELMGETANVNENLNVARENISALKNETSTLVYDFGQFNTEITNAVTQAQALTNEFSSMRYYVDMVKAEEQGLIQMEEQAYKLRMDNLTALQSGESQRIQKLHNIIDYLHMEEQQMEANASIQKDIIARLERESAERRKIAQILRETGQLHMQISREENRQLTYFEKEALELEKSNAELTRYWETKQLIAETGMEEIEALNILNDEYARLVGFGDELVMLNTKRSMELAKVWEDEDLVLKTIQEEIAMTEELLSLEKTRESTAKRTAQNKQMGNKNQLDKMGYLPSRIGSMALTMWGFNEIMDVYNMTMGHINAQSQRDYFAKRMNMDSKAVKEFNSSLVEMQKEYQKVDMTVVGANALETATKYKVQADSVDDLTEVMAIYGSEFVKQGRSQEDSILAVNDALDGELRRLKEVGIGAEELKDTGLWSGDASDKKGMILALKQIADERGYTKTAKDIVTLSDAITQLELRISVDLARAFTTIEPLLRDVMKNFVIILEQLEKAIGIVVPKITEFAKSIGLIDKNGNATKFGQWLESSVSWFITLGIVAFGVYKVIKPIVGVFKKLRGATDDIGETTGDMGKTMNTGGFKENFKSEWGKLGKNLGKMARVFVEVAVAMAMAFALIEEGILLISGIGYTYESLKPQFNSGIEFIKEFGLWFALLGGAMLVLSYAMGQIPDSAMSVITKGATKLAYGMAIALGLVAEAIALLILPMTAIALLGGTANFLGTNLDKGLEVISWIGDALHKIDLPIALFIGGFIAVSLLLGLVQPLTLALGIGIASALLLVTEAIGMLIPPLTAIALLGGTASALGEANIQQGAEAIKIIGKCLQVLAEAIPNLLIVDIGVFAVQLVDWGNKLLSGGKDGLTTLVEDILPTLIEFVGKFNGLEVGEGVDNTKVQAITQMATDIPPLFTAMQKLNQAMGTTDVLGNLGGAIGGSLSGGMGMGLKGKLDQLYNDVKDVMDFATKLGGLQGENGADASALTQTTNAIALLKQKLDLLVTTISTASTRVKTASKSLGSAIKVGFSEGTTGFNTSVVSVIASGIREVQSRYDTWHSGGKASAQKLADGFNTLSDKLGSTIDKEMGYALEKLDGYKDDFYSKGQALGSELTRGFDDGADIHSPGLIARHTARELQYTMESLNIGEKMMYQGGVALGQALTNGYNSYGNLRTDVGVLAQKGVSNEDIKANARKVQANNKGKGQTQQSLNPTINIDMSNSTVIGVTDLDAKIRQAVEKAIVSINSPNGAIGY